MTAAATFTADLPAAIAIVRCPDPARWCDAAVIAACDVVTSLTRVGVERDMAVLLRGAITAGRGV